MTGLRLVVVGLGRQGRRLAAVAARLDGVSDVILVDPALNELDGRPVHEDIDAALAAGGADGALVAVPTRLHEAVASELLERGIPTFVEKPLAADADAAARLCGLSESSVVPLWVGHVERFNPAVGLVKELIESGRVGRAIELSFRRLGLPPSDPDVDVVHDLAVHDIDIFAWIAGSRPRLIGSNRWPQQGLAEAAQLLLRAGDVNGSVQVNWRTPVRVRDFTVTTDACVIEVNYTTQAVELIEPSEPEQFDEFAVFQSHYGSALKRRFETRTSEPIVDEIRALVAALRGADPDPRLATAADGAAAVAVADQATAGDA
ncbi:MAG: UDP-N-acetylglucosamine 3-dehydrogenase [Acidimicrobiaceae bacterium]